MKEKIFKYLKTICLWILIVSFITSAISFSLSISDYVKIGLIKKNPTDTDLINYANSIETSIDKVTTELKDTYGENYPALGISYYETTLHYSSERLVQNFIFELIAGFALGNIMYFIFVAKYKKLKLFFALIIALLITAVLFCLSDILTNFVNGEGIDFTLKNILWTMELTAVPYMVLSILLLTLYQVYSYYIEIKNS